MDPLSPTDSVTISDSAGLYTVNSHLSLRLSRAELASTLECREETPALEQPVLNELSLDLQGNKSQTHCPAIGGGNSSSLPFPLTVRPTKMSLTGVKHHTVQGTKVLLQCQVSARPGREISIVEKGS